MLRSPEAPLELQVSTSTLKMIASAREGAVPDEPSLLRGLQVMETQLRKRMEQVKELFADCTDVFEELMVVKKHLAEKIKECLSAVENIQCSVSKVEASAPKVETQLQVRSAATERVSTFMSSSRICQIQVRKAKKSWFSSVTCHQFPTNLNN